MSLCLNPIYLTLTCAVYLYFYMYLVMSGGLEKSSKEKVFSTFKRGKIFLALTEAQEMQMYVHLTVCSVQSVLELTIFIFFMITS